MLRLSILDQSVAVVDRPHGQSIRDTVALAVVDNLIAYVGGKPPKTPVPETPFKGW